MTKTEKRVLIFGGLALVIALAVLYVLGKKVTRLHE